MKRSNKISFWVPAGGLVAGLALSPAWAGGPAIVEAEPLPEMPVSAGADWQGLRFGLAAAIPSGDNRHNTISGGGTTPGDWSGTTPVLSVGYDWQRGNLVYGAVFSLSAGEIDAVSVSTGSFGCSGGNCETLIEGLVTLRGRVGLSMGRTLIFASAGVAKADATASLGPNANLGDDALTGWTAGIGVEHMISQKLSLSAEYLQTDLGRLDIGPPCGVSCYTDVDFGQVLLGINYHW